MAESFSESIPRIRGVSRELMAHVGNTTVDPNAGPARENTRSEAVTIPETSARLGHYELFVVVSDIGREQLAPPPLQRISLDDVSPFVR